MKRVLLATTALFALSGVTVAAADVSLSGHYRWEYNAWSDDVKDANKTTYALDPSSSEPATKATTTYGSAQNNNKFGGELNLWVKANMVSDSGLEYGGAARIRDADVDRRYITLADDWGKVTLGKQWSPAYSMSLGQDWRGTISYGDAPKPSKDAVQTSSYDHVSTSGKANKIIYETPDISGFKAGISFADAGAESKGNSTEYALQYGMSAFGDGTLKVGYAAASQSAKDSEDASTKQSNHEIGAELSTGDLTLSAITFKKKATPNKGAGKVEQSGQEVDLSFKASDSLTANLVYYTAEVDEGTNKDDSYKWTGIGAKYTFAPGLWSSASYKTFDYDDKSGKANDNSGNAIRIRVHVGF